MSYLNAKEALPEPLLRELQMYVEGSSLYVPRREGAKQPWGSDTDTKMVLKARNLEIRRKYDQNHSVEELEALYFLSEKTIRKICK